MKKVDITNIKDLIGSQTKVMVYGFFNLGTFNLSYSLRANGYDVYDWVSKPFKDIPIDSQGYTHRFCKATLTGLFLENYKRSKEGQEILPLIFCLGKDRRVLDLKSLAAHTSYTKVTNSELRRIYKMYSEAEPALQDIILRTVHFITLETRGDEYIVKKAPVFWKTKNWSKIWEQRSAEKKVPQCRLENRYPWRNVLEAEMMLYNLSFFQRTENAQTKKIVVDVSEQAKSSLKLLG